MCSIVEKWKSYTSLVLLEKSGGLIWICFSHKNSLCMALNAYMQSGLILLPLCLSGLLFFLFKWNAKHSQNKENREWLMKHNMRNDDVCNTKFSPNLIRSQLYWEWWWHFHIAFKYCVIFIVFLTRVMLSFPFTTAIHNIRLYYSCVHCDFI